MAKIDLLRAVFALVCLLGCACEPLKAQHPSFERPVLVRLTVVLEDGRSYGLTTELLGDPRGGAIFWSDWAVIHMLLPQYQVRPTHRADGSHVLRLWFTPGPSGQLPAFLVNTAEGPIDPLDGDRTEPWALGALHRPELRTLELQYADGRVFRLGSRVLNAPKSGVLVWNDFAVAHFFLPFYRGAQGVLTRPEDVLKLWYQPRPAAGFKEEPVPQELPGYLVKPYCIPTYPGDEGDDG